MNLFHLILIFGIIIAETLTLLRLGLLICMSLMFITITNSFQIAIAVLYCSNKRISEVEPCELKTALDSLHVKYTFQPCTYSVISDNSNKQIKWRKAELWISFVVTLLVIICALVAHSRYERIDSVWVRVVCFVVSIKICMILHYLV